MRLRSSFLVLGIACLASQASGQSPVARNVDWEAVGREGIELLSRYVQIDTSVPPGVTIESADLLEAFLEREGFETRRFDSEPGVTTNLLARLPASVPAKGKPILLLHHMDVVPADASRWDVNPFGGEITDGRLWGRGAMDMKGIGVLHLMALTTLKRQAVALERDVLLLAVSDEEVGGERGARWMLEHHPELLDVEYVFDEGGFGARDVLAEDRLVFNVAVAEKKIVWVKLTARGVAGHGSQPHPENPNDRLVAALNRVLAMPPMGQAPPVVRELRSRVGKLASNKFTHAITHTTTSLTSLQSGVGVPPKVNVIPSVAEATLDNRLLPGVSVDAFIAALHDAIADPAISVEVLYESGGTPVTPWDSRLFGIVERAILRHHPGAIVTPSPIPYGTDSNSFRLRGAGAYGLAPLVLSLDIVSSMHSDAESVPTQGFGTGVRIFFEILSEYAGAISE